MWGCYTNKKGEKFKEPGKACVVHLLSSLSLILKLTWSYTDKSSREQYLLKTEKNLN